ncbi:hypothetical protein D623_10019288 [Myotis brandtii]|uniref:Uncharacterized protein n=1 Tax=Myotis brandtii TaxID=109478 RepID=S7NGI7_MYOBR|nr:hypothetical protein D623_10019288 [Myotis brandtii]
MFLFLFSATQGLMMHPEPVLEKSRKCWIWGLKLPETDTEVHQDLHPKPPPGAAEGVGARDTRTPSIPKSPYTFFPFQCPERPWLRRPRPPLPTRLLLPFASFSLCTDKSDRRDWATATANALLFTMNHPEGQTEKAELSAGAAGPGWETKRQRSSGCWGEAVATESLAQEHTPTKEPSFITRGGSE